MNASKLGENLTREWSEEPRAAELWDALKLIESQSWAGIELLEQFAESGSSLAMMYLGDVYLNARYGVCEDRDLGEYWLRRSADAGSIEGAYELAWHFLNSGKSDAALAEYLRLADLKYSPALFVLGWQYYKGTLVERNVEKALDYFRLAEQKGHLHAAHWSSHILMRKQMGPVSWMRGVAKRIALIIPFVRTWVNYPKSDLLRT